LHKFAHNEALRFRVLPAALPQASGAKENVDALISDLGNFVDAEQNNFDIWVLLLKRRNGVQQKPP
jgi:hypothetical protein